MFDLLVREVAAKFGLGDKAGWILSTLLGFMFQKQSGGLGGLLDLFKQKGLASIASTWLGGGKGMPLGINPAQLENVIGGSLIKEIASKTGLASGPIGGALAFMLPKIVRALTPDGVIPTGIPAAISQYLGSSEEKTPPPVRAAAPTPTALTPQSKGFPWWWILIPLILLLGWCALRKPAEVSAPAAQTAPPAAPAPAAVTEINPKLVLNNDGGKVYYTGTVTDEVARTSVMDAIKAAFGDAASGEISVDKSAKSANWLGMLAQFLPELKSISGSKLMLDGDDITLDGSMPQSDIDGLMGKLKSVFGDKFNIKSVAQVMAAAAAPAAEPPPTAPMDDAAKNAAASAKMDELKAAGNISGADLVSVLNLAVINFATGSATISPNSMAILKKAAETLKAAADGTKVEIGGHTDNVGNPATNMKLSEARAKSVMGSLIKLGVKAGMLTAKGYGDTKPVGPNDTAEGKAKNRRMEFSVAQ